VVSRDELNARELEELAALDLILAREPVGEEHLELAALLDSVRAGAPTMAPAFAERLDAQLDALGRRRRFGWLRDRGPRVRRLALAGGGLVAAAVAFTIVISSGVFSGGSSQHLPAAPHAFSGAAVATPTPATAGGAASATPRAAVGASTPASPTLLGPQPLPVGGSGRLVERRSTLTLATTPATMPTVANQIVSATEQEGGVVANSNVAVQGSASYSNFELQVPSGHLGRLISTLSGLASVRGLNQTTDDITDGYDVERARLADNEAERAGLLKQLATAATTASETSIQQKLNRVEARIAAEHRAIDALLTEGHTAVLYVNVVPGASAKHSTVGPLGAAFNRALHALEEILAIALIALAIALPFALCALALWWAASGIRQRARERAMRTA
jgi:primosomal protein N''